MILGVGGQGEELILGSARILYQLVVQADPVKQPWRGVEIDLQSFNVLIHTIHRAARLDFFIQRVGGEYQTADFLAAVEAVGPSDEVGRLNVHIKSFAAAFVNQLTFPNVGAGIESESKQYQACQQQVEMCGAKAEMCFHRKGCLKLIKS